MSQPNNSIDHGIPAPLLTKYRDASPHIINNLKNYIDPDSKVHRDPNCTDCEAQMLYEAPRCMAEQGFACFPEQTELENLEWLLSAKHVFADKVFELKNILDDKFMEFFCKNVKPKDPAFLTWFKKTTEEWLDKYKVTVTFQNWDNIQKFKDIDVRFWQVLWRDGATRTQQKSFLLNMNNKEHQENINQLKLHVYGNLSHALPQQADGWQPQPTEFSLMAWGTASQSLHSDYPFYVGPKKNNIIDWPKEVPLDHWHGSFMYVFEDKHNTLHHAPCIYTLPNQRKTEAIEKRTRLPRFIQQKFCCMFPAPLLHAGGVNGTPCIRLHVHLDPPEGFDLPKRALDKVGQPSFAEPLSKTAKKQRLIGERKIAQHGGLKKPKMVRNLYHPNHVLMGKDQHPLAEKWDKTKARYDKSNEKKRLAKAMKNPPKQQGSPEDNGDERKMSPAEAKKLKEDTTMRV